MFRNSVFHADVNTEEWITNALIRAVKTFAQSAVSLITVGQMITDLNWMEIIGISGTAAIVSLLTSIAGIPEVKHKEEE